MRETPAGWIAWSDAPGEVGALRWWACARGGAGLQKRQHSPTKLGWIPLRHGFLLEESSTRRIQYPGSTEPGEDQTEVLGSERLTGAPLDRLTHRCKIIETNGESYRLHDMKARTRRPKAATPAETIDAAAATNQLLTEVLPLSTGARAPVGSALTDGQPGPTDRR
jgi:hypothetical protein